MLPSLLRRLVRALLGVWLVLGLASPVAASPAETRVRGLDATIAYCTQLVALSQPANHRANYDEAARNAVDSCVAAEGGAAALGEGTVSVFHGSIDNGAAILRSGLDAARAPTFVTRDLSAATNALAHHPNAIPGAGTIIESRIPASLFQQTLAPLERPYSGFYPYGLNSTEITLRSSGHIELFNRFIVKP